jgi:hypothetical protein
MRHQILPETELLLMQIAEKHYPRTHFKVISRFEFEVDNWIEIDFLAYLSESTNERPYSDPFHKYYRRDRFDFNVAFSLKDSRLFVSSNWREVILTLQYSLSDCSWWDEGEIIPRPYPHGDKLEAIAKEIYPLLIK